ncbi:MAG: molybdopterin-dependent oxidoreductase, partial [Bryobacteraceae bacterium]
GWSTIVEWSGARFSDFTRKYLRPGFAPKYVYMETPDQQYYVGLDMKSAMHPQTLLAYERNGKPLTPDHGAPLRLVIPVKYGIKSIKRIGLIQYTNTRPGDYWAEEGYDWYSGL